jgi:putative addiction module CopG family antidote
LGAARFRKSALSPGADSPGKPGKWFFDISVQVRYTGQMNISVPLSPHVEQFVREQLANGFFQTESDVILAALRLLEEQSVSHGPLPARPKQNLETGAIGKPSEPVSKEFWDGLRERLHADRMPGKEAARISSVRRSPRGILADLRSHINPDDIKEARMEMWSGFPHGDA